MLDRVWVVFSPFTLISIDTLQMPPPPMPASLDPTTVSSLAHAHVGRSASPRGSIQWDKNGVPTTWIPPQTQASASASSGRSSQPPSQGTFSAPPPPPNSTIARSLVPTQVNYGTLSPSTSSPLAMQAHPPPSVSPSVTFSKLSLHSPDVSSSPNLSVLCTPNESTMSFSSSASTLSASDHRSLSPPHRPSKPLHVHPQNESPSLPTSLSAPVVTLDASDGTRDTPAEAQHQQPHLSSSESQHETHPASDVEKKRPANGEAHRVRFASPEILSGMPRLKGRVSSDSLESHGGVLVDPDAIEDIKQQEAPTLNRDAMDVEVDVIGDNQEDGSVPHATSAESKLTDVVEDAYSSSPVPGSPPSQAPPDSQCHNILSVEDGAALGHDLSQTASDVNETTSQAEPIVVESTPTEPAQEQSPPPAPKVKMSLKDFALRKKKQREEEMAAKAHDSPVTPDGPALPLSPGVDVKQDLASEHAYSGEVNGQDVKMNDVTKEDALASPATVHVSANGGSAHGHDVVPDTRLAEDNAAAEDDKLSAEAQAPSTTVATQAPDTPRTSPRIARSSTISLRVLGEQNHSGTDQTQMQIDAKPSMTLIAKMEVMDAIVPSGLVGADDPPPNVVSFAPEPPPPPLTTKQTSETTTTDHTVPIGSISRSAPSSTPASISTPTSMSTSTPTSAVNSRSNSVGIPASTPSLNSLPHALLPSSLSSVPSSRRPSQEDGEITSSTPPKAYLPRSHTPPTQPRSFNAVHPSSPNLGPTLSSTPPVPRRPVPPLSRSPLTNNANSTPTPMSSRPLPSGPRALRGSMSQPTHPYASPRPPYAGSQYIPRGPSADRDRMDWERGDRQWTAQARTRGRAGSNGWGR